MRAQLSHTPLTTTRTACSLPVSELERNGQGWLLDGEIRQHSQATLTLRKIILDKLLWFLTDQKCTAIGTLELRQFIVYLSRGHEQEGGRWGNPHMSKTVTPSTVQTYHRALRTFFRCIVQEGILEASPMESVPTPIARPDQIQPFTPEQMTALLKVARRSQQPRRDTAILTFLVDTGLRASELCSMRLRDLDMQSRKCTIVGKGKKKRSVPFGGTATKELWQY
jgi:site-specific recombinase XerD